MKPIGLKVLGTGTAFPKNISYNPPESDTWIRENLGIETRHHAVEYGERTSDLATIAAHQALENAKLSAFDIGMIVVATSSPDRLAPATATLVQRNLGCQLAFAFDLNAVCSGWLYGLTIAAQFIDTGHIRNALIIGADTFSNFTDWADRDSVFFGDGAGAMIVGPGTGKFWSLLRSDGEGWDSWTIPGGGSEFPDERPIWEMVARDVYDRAALEVPQSVQAVVRFADYDISDVDWFIPHQASLRVLKEIATRLDLPWEKVAVNLKNYGNTASASTPTALHHIAHKIRPGDLVAFGVIGAGWTWGAGLLEWT